jgi:hypothetical protein
MRVLGGKLMPKQNAFAHEINPCRVDTADPASRLNRQTQRLGQMSRILISNHNIFFDAEPVLPLEIHGRDEVVAFQCIGSSEAAVERCLHRQQLEEGEVWEIDLGWRLRKRRRRRACAASSRSIFSALANTVMRACASGSPLPGSPASSEQRGSAIRLFVWAARLETRMTITPSKSVAASARLTAGKPLCASVTASET